MKTRNTSESRYKKVGYNTNSQQNRGDQHRSFLKLCHFNVWYMYIHPIFRGALPEKYSEARIFLKIIKVPVGYEVFRWVQSLIIFCPLNDVIMSVMASQITTLTSVYSTVCLGADQRKYQSSASLAFMREIHRWPVNFPHKGPVTRTVLPFDDVIMLSHCCAMWWNIKPCFLGTQLYLGYSSERCSLTNTSLGT